MLKPRIRSTDGEAREEKLLHVQGKYFKVM